MTPAEGVDLSAIFGAPRPIVGMIHLPPLPGAPGWSDDVERIVERALDDARLLAEGGVDGLLVENYGDAPFHPEAVPPETVAAMSRVVSAVVEGSALPVGVNVLRNDARAALGIAVATGARFIRVNVHSGVMFTDQGVLEGRAHETLRVRRALERDVAILADLLVKHATPPAGLTAPDAARDAWERGRADALVVSGPATGRAPGVERLRAVRDAVPEAPLWIGSGLSPENAGDLLLLADGAIVGSAVREGGRAGRPVEASRVRRFVEAAEGVR